MADGRNRQALLGNDTPCAWWEPWILADTSKGRGHSRTHAMSCGAVACISHLCFTSAWQLSPIKQLFKSFWEPKQISHIPALTVFFSSVSHHTTNSQFMKSLPGKQSKQQIKRVASWYLDNLHYLENTKLDWSFILVTLPPILLHDV